MPAKEPLPHRWTKRFRKQCEQGEMRPLPAAMDSPGARGRVPVSPVPEGQQPDVNLDKPQNDNGEQKELRHHRQTCRWDLNAPCGPPAAQRSAASAGRPGVSGLGMPCSHH